MRLTLFLTIIALLSACSGEKGKIILKGELTGLRQGELLVWNNDGMGSCKIDTVKIDRGQFEYISPASEEVSSWTLVYPNMSTITFFGTSGDVLELEGKANELRRVSITGTLDNELYTALRRGTLTADSIITSHPTTALARYLLKTEYIDNDKTDRKVKAHLFQLMREANPDDSIIASWERWAQEKDNLAIGEKLPRFSLITSEGDTITDSTFLGSNLLIGVWWSAEVDCRRMLKAFRDTRRTHKAKKVGKKGKTDKLELLTVNIDLDPKTRSNFESMDSINWHRVNTGALYDHTLLRDWHIESVPYIILVDTAGIVRAIGKDFESDIQPNL